MTTCLVLGGGGTLWDDLNAYHGPRDGVVAVNEAGTVWPGELDAWVSLHVRYMVGKGWRKARADAGYPEAKRHVGHMEAFIKDRANKPGMTPDLEGVHYMFPEQTKSGSSGLFGAKFALLDLGFDRVVFCGVPMTPTPHFWDRKQQPWRAAEDFRTQWMTLAPAHLNRMRSMSGWTRQLLGAPEIEGETNA